MQELPDTSSPSLWSQCPGLSLAPLSHCPSLPCCPALSSELLLPWSSASRAHWVSPGDWSVLGQGGTAQSRHRATPHLTVRCACSPEPLTGPVLAELGRTNPCRPRWMALPWHCCLPAAHELCMAKSPWMWREHSLHSLHSWHSWHSWTQEPAPRVSLLSPARLHITKSLTLILCGAVWITASQNRLG